ncbi:M28 family peptidase [Occultella aeris]|uniref:Aminopeptidase YwaD n=1 Tax=Occultella aeris TaxID=2761496 RepID=A0A7M4DRG5_9MICO|nr:M28 family peptidase [Occultella aeris]VZO40059.1 Aminopeptidase YwaD precursor [Occultella aeris]
MEKQPRVRRTRTAAIVLAAVAAAGTAATITAMSADPAPADAPAAHFSAARGVEQLEQLGPDPRTPGSAAHAQARAYLVTELDALGWETDMHESVGTFDEDPTAVSMATVSNVIATLPGTDPTGTVILAAHYDSVPGSPGAADDGIGIAAALESARALTAGEPPRNDVMVLLTDAEEPGLLGADAFVHDRAEQLGPAVLVNLEARGAGGLPASVRLTEPNGMLLDLLARTPRPVVDSFSDALFALLPNDTDLTRFTAGGIAGFDTAITGAGAYYHSPLDDIEHLSAASLQEMGAGTLAFARAAAGADLTRLPDGGTDVVTSLPWGLLRVPEGLELPLAALTVLLALAVVARARRRREMSLPRVALGAATAAVSLPLVATAAVGLWQLALAIDPGQASAVVGEPFVPWPYQVGVVALTLGLILGLRAALRRVLPDGELALGGLLTLALAGLGLALTLPGAAFVLVVAVFPAAIAALIGAGLPARARAVVLGAGLLPAAVMFFPAVVGMFEVGLGTGGPLAAVFVAVVALLALPLVDAARLVRPEREAPSRHRAVVPAALLAVVVVAAAGGLVANGEGRTDPRQEMLSYSLDADSGEALWTSWSPSGSAWSQDLLPSLSSDLADQPWLGGGAIANGPAAAADLPAPDVEVVSDRDTGTHRELVLELTSARGAPAIGLWVATRSADVVSATVHGRALPTVTPGPPPGADDGPWDFGFLLRGVQQTRVTLVLDPRAPQTQIRVVDLTHELEVVPGFEGPPHGRVLVTPNVYVYRTVEV